MLCARYVVGLAAFIPEEKMPLNLSPALLKPLHA